MNSSNSATRAAERAPGSTHARVVLASEAGVPFQPPPGKAGGVDPFAEWLSLMEVVHMLCPAWPVRQSPMRGAHWRL